MKTHSRDDERVQLAKWEKLQVFISNTRRNIGKLIGRTGIHSVQLVERCLSHVLYFYRGQFPNAQFDNALHK